MLSDEQIHIRREIQHMMDYLEMGGHGRGNVPRAQQ